MKKSSTCKVIGLFLTTVILAGCQGVSSGSSNQKSGDSSGGLTLSTSTLNFGNVSVGGSGKQNVNATNSGTSDVVITNAVSTDADFVISGETFPLTVAAGKAVPFTVTFTPKANGAASGTASFASNASNSPATLSMSGDGTQSAPPGAPVATVTVTPSSPTLLLWMTQQFSAVAKDSNGNIINDATFTWSSDASSVTTVDSSGLATPVGPGTAHVTATSGGVKGSAGLIVDSPPSKNADLFDLHILLGTTPPPTISFNGLRLLTAETLWGQIETSNGAYDFTPVDQYLAAVYDNGGKKVIYTVEQVPQWASSNPSDTACDYSYLEPGGCDLPTDIHANGSGTDQTWINFVTALAQHVNDPTYLQTHARIEYWEPWNEWYRNTVVNTYSWNDISIRATYAQMVRMTEDMRCVITGKGSVNGMPCTAPAIDPTAQILSPSDGGPNCNCGSVAVFQNFLYCDGTGASAPLSGSDCTTGSRGSAAVDIINSHFYEYDGYPPENLATDVPMYIAVLQPQDLAKPLWSDEGSWGSNSSVPDLDVQASWVVRYYLVGWSTGLMEMYWYAYDGANDGTLWTSSDGLQPAGQAWQWAYNWIVGSALTTPCSAKGTVWTCGLTLANGAAAQVIWDTSQTCSNGVCTTTSKSVSPTWTNYQDITGTYHSIIVSGSVSVGIKPILLM
jgi:hypothetical protein